MALKSVVSGKLSIIKLVIDMVSRIRMVISISGADGRITWREGYRVKAKADFHENRRGGSPSSLQPPASLMDMLGPLAF